MPYQVSEPLYSRARESTFKVNVFQGGTSAGKTYTILQALIDIACKEPGVIITVVGQDVPNLKKGAIRDAARIFISNEYFQHQVFNFKTTKGYNKTDRIYEFKNGSIIEFTSYENEQDARGGRRDYLFINECNAISYEIYWQLYVRTRKRVYLDYNPSARFWVHEKIIGQPNCRLTISDHRHNKFISEELHLIIENIDDPELWKVYARGLTGSIHGLIYPRYKMIDIMPTVYPICYGLDFGFNHKTALIEVAKNGSNLFWDEKIYQSELTIGDIIPMMKELGISRKTKIWCDHAAADKIEDLRRAGFNVGKADKDIKNGLDFVKRHNLYVTKSSKGILSEIGGYKYKVKVNPINGEAIILDEPAKFKDDAMDAGRYGSYTGFRKERGLRMAREDRGTMDLLDSLEEAA